MARGVKMLEKWEERELALAFERRGAKGKELEALIAKASAELEGGRPLAYITGEQPFYNLVFKVDERVLVPRPDTERVVEQAMRRASAGAHFADLCTGSGCIALTLLYNRRDLTAEAFDISEDALRVARDNADSLGLSDRVAFYAADVTSLSEKNRFLGQGEAAALERFDFIVSNPPYVRTSDIPLYPSLSYEPRVALDGGDDGLEFYRAITKLWGAFLKKGGFFVFEIGYDQAEGVAEICKKAGFDCKIFKDYGGNDRVAILEKSGAENRTPDRRRQTG